MHSNSQCNETVVNNQSNTFIFKLAFNLVPYGKTCEVFGDNVDSISFLHKIPIGYQQKVQALNRFLIFFRFKEMNAFPYHK